MNNNVTRRITAKFVFNIGFLLMFLGIAFLIGSLAEFSRVSILFSSLMLIMGVKCAVIAIKLNRRSLYLFFAALFLQTGLFFFLFTLNIIPFRLSQVWPILSVFAGIALFPAGWHRYGVLLSSYVVPSIAFVVLGSILMIFSFNLVDFSLAQFVRNWWHLLLALAGLVLILVSFGARKMGDTKR